VVIRAASKVDDSVNLSEKLTEVRKIIAIAQPPAQPKSKRCERSFSNGVPLDFAVVQRDGDRVRCLVPSRLLPLGTIA
jgi:hypothetical protein